MPVTDRKLDELWAEIYGRSRLWKNPRPRTRAKTYEYIASNWRASARRKEAEIQDLQERLDAATARIDALEEMLSRTKSDNPYR